MIFLFLLMCAVVGFIIYLLVNVYAPFIRKLNSEINYLIADINELDKKLNRINVFTDAKIANQAEELARMNNDIARIRLSNRVTDSQ